MRSKCGSFAHREEPVRSSFCVRGLVVECFVAIEATRVRFPADAINQSVCKSRDAAPHSLDHEQWCSSPFPTKDCISSLSSPPPHGRVAKWKWLGHDIRRSIDGTEKKRSEKRKKAVISVGSFNRNEAVLFTGILSTGRIAQG